ncbi:MAG TPA: hypothetical protein DCK83_00395 [Gallionellaceae bacterium]|nr:hypothetical protein [Gallionellaceae bacterium]
MTIVYSTAVKNSRLNVVRDAIDGGSGAGYIEICTAAYASVLATIPLSNPCSSGAAAGVLILTTPATDTSADNTGTAAIARIKDSNGTVVCDGLTVGTTGSNINLSSVGITATDSVSITSAAITHG